MVNRPVLLILLLTLVSGCSARALTVRMAGPLVEAQYASINEETDPVLAEQAMPASLKMLEGMLKEDPENTTLLNRLAEGFCGYSFSFVEDAEPQRASELYLRGLDYAHRALVSEGAPENLMSQTPQDFKKSLQSLGADHLYGLFWMGQCWASWLMLNLDDLKALVAIPKVEFAMQRVMELDESYFYAGPHLFFGAYYGGRPKMLGGDSEKSRTHFETGLKLTHRKYLMIQLLYAKTYAVQMQDRELFKKLLNEVLEAPADILPEQKLANAVAKTKARKLQESVDDFF